MAEPIRALVRSLLPFALRSRLARAFGSRNPRDLAGRIGAGGLHAYVARGVTARRWRHVSIGAGAQVERGTHFHCNDEGPGKRIVIGERCFVGQHCFFSAGESIVVRRDAVIGASCNFLAAGHLYDDPTCTVARAAVTSYGPMILGVNTWTGVGTTVLGGVEIGFGSIVAAGSLLRMSLPPLCLAAGHPARIIRIYDWPSKAWVTLPTDEPARETALHRHMQNLPSEAAYLEALRH
jgi:acetyltransferase-like isoleucine patch superfamily enzyme